jgi:hypothetical protein
MKNKNAIRDISNVFKKYLKKNNISMKIVGWYYQFIHYMIIVLAATVMLFNNNPFHLTLLLIVISLDAFSVVILHNCPLTILEQKYLKTSLVKERMDTLRKSKIVYKCDHVYEQQIELLINVWCLIACKILFILTMKTINKNIIFQVNS